MLTRRKFFIGLGAVVASGLSSISYAFGIEPFRMRVKRHAVTPAGWKDGPRLRVALIADLHACEPWMNLERVAYVVETANALKPDITLLLGDYEARHKYVRALVPAKSWAAALARLEAPLGVHAILGNHDWWDDRQAQVRGKGPVFGRRALEAAGIPVYENDVVRLQKDGRPFWLAGLADQIALAPKGVRDRRRFIGLDDLAGTLAKVTDDAPVLLMAHEPDIFPRVPARVALTVSGHTHGGQLRMLGYSPVVPSRYGNRYAYGHIAEQREGDAAARHLVVSGGLGCSIIPMRLGVPPEIVLLDLAPTPTS
ncbi:MAG: metallophosphoesterase [Hyphomicrobiales bacterium]|nr:MAG: metallophosphoesterase [Hyphomicrobiales bacterium]